MAALKNTLNTLRKLDHHHYYSLAALEEQGHGSLKRLPISIRIILESLLRNCDEIRVSEKEILSLINWPNKSNQSAEVPFVVSRVILQDFTGVPLLVDLAAMRDAVASAGYDPSIIEPQVPVDLVIDHSVQVDRSATNDAFDFNMQLEFKRNIERYEFLKWGQKAFKTFKVVPPGIGIVHQVNLEHIADVVSQREIDGHSLLFPDTLVGTDSHTTMINGLGIVGWGVGGIEAEAAMLGQPVALQMPEVIGFHLSGELPKGASATDLALRVTEILRKENVVDKFIEFFGEGTQSLGVADRSTIANMAPEYGATMGFFPVDDKTLEYLQMTGRSQEKISLIRQYLLAQDLFGVRKENEIDFSKVLHLDLRTVSPSVAGPKRPQDRIVLSDVKKQFSSLLRQPIAEGGYGKKEENIMPVVEVHMANRAFHQHHQESGGIGTTPPGAPRDVEEMVGNRPYTCSVSSPGYSGKKGATAELSHGSVVIAAITSCTNTSNPSVMLAAGLVAKKAVEAGLTVPSYVKTSLAPGSRVVTEYLQKSGLQRYLDMLGFHLVGYGCTTCIGNSGPLDENIEESIKEHDLIVSSVLSGNRNFEARIHSAVKANFLMSPPLVVAYALSGTIYKDLSREPIGKGKDGKDVFLKDLWPSEEEIKEMICRYIDPDMFKQRYAHLLEDAPLWKKIPSTHSLIYPWEAKSTYIQHPPYFSSFSQNLPPRETLTNMRCLALLGDSVTTDHISPAGSFKANTPAGLYLLSQGVKEEDFNSYGSRRGNHHVMMRGTFANVRIKNKMAEGKEGGFTKLIPEGSIVPIFDACMHYREKKIPLILFAGKDYGMGSSRDWAAKGTNLLGVKVVVAQSFERIHRSNLIGMGVLPLEFSSGQSLETLHLCGDEEFTLVTSAEPWQPKQKVQLKILSHNKENIVELICRLDTQIEIEYYMHGGILPFVLRGILAKKN